MNAKLLNKESAKEIELLYSGSSTASARWARFGPYYAMFPIDFAFEVVEKYSKKGEWILDPFSGRGSSVYAGGVLGRVGYGIEINPLGWIYSKTKLCPADKESVLNRLREIYDLNINYKAQLEACEEFFRICYCDEVLAFLLAAREFLDWKNNEVDRSLMAFICVHLHGAIGENLSNQMKQTKAMGARYSINWWKTKGLDSPPKINPYELLKTKIEWRYKKGFLSIKNGDVFLAESTKQTQKMAAQKKFQNKFSLLFTSPPYRGVTNYFNDQWLRLWLLDGKYKLKDLVEKPYFGSFDGMEFYRQMLGDIFDNCAKMMKQKSVVYVRTDVRKFTFETTLEVLKKSFPSHRVSILDSPVPPNKTTQTLLYGVAPKEQGERDIILTSL